MNPDWHSIETPRLVLRTLPLEALRALAAGARADASRLAGCDLADFPDEERAIAELRLKDVTAPTRPTCPGPCGPWR
ncbi:MAG TPA: hypothetical protein VFG64_01310 [Dongiaceae bacterium]|nr:hypothetical protein [Dongiaceae bacterium]